MPVVLLAARGLGQLAGWAVLGWLMVIATLFVPHSDCTHRPAQPSQNTRKKGSSLSGVAGPRSGPRLGGSPLIGLVSPLRGWCLVDISHFVLKLESVKSWESE